MKKLIIDNYNSIVARGLITSETTHFDFVMKLAEEFSEWLEFYDQPKRVECAEELADIILVCLNFAHHYGIDIKQEIKDKIDKNILRAQSSK